jgi:predicted alpha/beta hydrolase family esterase
MDDILTSEREKWAERFLVLALWYEAATDAKQRLRARDAVLVAHALTSDTPIETIPVMTLIAAQTVRAMLLGAW